MSEISPKALELHRLMAESPKKDELFTQADLQGFLKDPEELLKVAQELLNNQMIKAAKMTSGELAFQWVAAEEADKVKKMTSDEAMVYSYIEASGREGIWTKTIKMKSNLHQHVVLRCLKSLENQRYIKAIKSVKHPTRKIYMLASLQPSEEVTGGPWFTDSELDSEFIDNLLAVVWNYVVSQSFPNAFKSYENLPRDSLNKNSVLAQQSYPAAYTGYPELSDIHKFVRECGITSVELGMADISALCDVLIYDEKIEKSNGGTRYKATWHSVAEAGIDKSISNGHGNLNPFTEVPCGMCPSFSVCESKGPVSAPECPYFDEWLQL